jgi:hypothetical protein
MIRAVEDRLRLFHSYSDADRARWDATIRVESRPFSETRAPDVPRVTTTRDPDDENGFTKTDLLCHSFLC